MSSTPFSPIEIRLPKEVTFYEATALHKVWTGQLEEAGPAPLAIRDEALETCDTAGAQLLALLLFEARRRNPAYRPGERLARVLQPLQLPPQPQSQP